jgi:hypothetical protein
MFVYPAASGGEAVVHGHEQHVIFVSGGASSCGLGGRHTMWTGRGCCPQRGIPPEIWTAANILSFDWTRVSVSVMKVHELSGESWKKVTVGGARWDEIIQMSMVEILIRKKLFTSTILHFPSSF